MLVFTRLFLPTHLSGQDLGHESELLRDIPHGGDFTPEKLATLQEEIELEDEDERPTRALQAR
jgi:hypothetical protein